MNEAWQEMTIEQTEEKLNTNIKWGMTSELAEEKRKQKPAKQIKRSPLHFFLSSIAEPFHILMLIVALLLMVEGRAVFGVLTVALLIVRSIYLSLRLASFENVKVKAQKLRVPSLAVLRDGNEITVSADSMVEGDIEVLRAGDIVCFPMKIAEDNGLIFLPPDAGEDYLITDDDKMVDIALPGMKVAFGEGKGIVLDNTYTYEEVQQSEKLPEFLQGSRFLVWTAISLFLSLLVSAISIAKGNDVIDCFLSAVGVFVATCPLAIPDGFKLCNMEGLQKINTSAVLSPLSAKKLREATFIALTEKDVASSKLKMRGVITSYNEFNMDYIYSGQDKAVLKMIEEMACICTDLELQNGLYQGDELDKAVIDGANKHGVFKETLAEKYPEVFRKQTDNHTTVGVEIPNGVRVISKGDVKEILGMCDSIMTDGDVVKIDMNMQSAMLNKAEQLAETGSYVFAIAFSDNEKGTEHEKTNLCFLGLICISHQADSSKLAFIKKCRAAQLEPLLMTSLEKEKAEVIAGFYIKTPYILTGEEIDNLTDKDLKQIIGRADGYAELSSAQKVRVLSLLKESGQNVLYPAETEEDILFESRAYVSIAPDNAPQNIKRVCDGTVSHLAQIPEIKKATINLYRNQNNLLAHNFAVKLGILLCLLLASICLPYGPADLLQYWWLGILIIPLNNYMILKAEDLGLGTTETKAKYSSLINGVLIGVIGFIIQFSSYFSLADMSFYLAGELATGMTFWFMLIAILVLGLQAQSAKLFTAEGFKNKKGLLMALICIIATLVVQFVTPITEQFLLTIMQSVKLLWVPLFAVIMIILTDLIKWILFKIGKKGK